MCVITLKGNRTEHKWAIKLTCNNNRSTEQTKAVHPNEVARDKNASHIMIRDKGNWMNEMNGWSSEWICKCAHFYNRLLIKIQIEFEWWTSSCVEAPKVTHSRNKPVHSTFKCIVPSKRWMKRNSYNLFFFSHSKLTLMRLHLIPFSASNEITPFNLSCFWFVCAILMFANA